MTNTQIGDEFIKELSPGEKLLWTGKPKTGIIFRRADALLIPFSLAWCAFAIFWEVLVLKADSSIGLKIWGIPSVLFGIYVLIGRFFIDARKRANTLYGITENKILIKTGVFNPRTRSIHISSISAFAYSEKKDASGTIVIGSKEITSILLQGIEWPGLKQPPMLELIPDVKTVYDILTALKKINIVEAV